ncbi:MAG: XRE family transcriptional regulator [Gammaproteobacteria bacterium]|nr:XRE family transcriptional regulator [Gammaproteobacteria bacterium]MDE0274192.1 XRE family transcriptional regulator [Gammaproteobacteria bacterium]
MLHRETGDGRRTKFATGQTIRARRQELGMTLQALGEKSGLSTAFISQVERGQASASMVSLMNLARALDVNVTTFMEIPMGEAPIRRRDNPQYIEIDSPVQYVQLSAGMKLQQLDIVLMTIPPGHVFPVDQREGEDFLYVLEGELYTELGDLKETLREGDCTHFNSRTPHTASNLTTKDVVLLYVGTPSVFKPDQ